MLRLIHTQTVQGSLLINDIDDGIPNKTAKHGTGNPKRYHRDGNSLGGIDKSIEPDVNWPKQKCYVPRVKATDPTIPGYIDIKETDRVLISVDRGTIGGFQNCGKLTVVSFTDADVVAPVVTWAQIGIPSAGKLTITGTGLTSLTPNITRVIITGTGAVTLTQAAIVAGGGTVTAVSIVVPSGLIPGIVDPGSDCQVLADDQLSNVFALVKAPAIATARVDVPNVGDLTITGTNFTSHTPRVSSVIITGAGAVTRTQAAILAGGGTFSDTSIFIPAALVPGIGATVSSAQVSAEDTLVSNVYVITI